jgi:protein-tyrosine phosphatase
VLPNLLVGSQDVAVDKQILDLHKVTHILSVGVPGLRIPADNVVHLFLDLLDLPESPLKEKLSEACDFIQKGLANGTVFVHCNAGVSRAPTIVVGFLIKCRGMSPEEALRLVKEKRPCAKPNEGFWKALVKIHQEMSK